MNPFNPVEDLIGMMLLSKLLENSGVNRSNNAALNDIQLIHKASKIRVYIVADKIAQGPVSGSVQVKLKDPNAQELEIPVQDKWSFKLGDRVRVKFPLARFKSIQKNTIGWDRKLEAVHGETGYVVGFHSQYDNSIEIHFPDILTTASLYAGVLDKDDSQVIEPCAWKVGDYVRTDEDKSVVKLLQRKLNDIPDFLVGQKGQVVATTPKVIFVTFDGLHSFTCHSALLRPIANTTAITRRVLRHSRGFQIGEKVSVISNLKALISNQQGKGGWSPQMIGILGKVVIITDINADGTIDVRYKSGKSYKLNAQSVFRLQENPRDEGIRDLSLRPNDKVNFVDVVNASQILRSQGIPPQFEEVLKQVAIVHSVTDDLEAMIRYNNDDKLSINMSFLQKASAKDAAIFENRQNNLKSLKAKQTVRFDVGPPNYVREILRQSGAKREVIETLTKPAVLRGFIDESHVIVHSSTGCMYKINKKYLTLP